MSRFLQLLKNPPPGIDELVALAKVGSVFGLYYSFCMYFSVHSVYYFKISLQHNDPTIR